MRGHWGRATLTRRWHGFSCHPSKLQAHPSDESACKVLMRPPALRVAPVQAVCQARRSAATRCCPVDPGAAGKQQPISAEVKV